ncbi:MAG: hypothetical protein ACPKQO_05600 [Nitrososphaeraceae archaeon]
MPRTKSLNKSDDKNSLPKWAEDEIKSVQFDNAKILSRTGYILEIYNPDHKLDIQLYEPLPDKRTIIEGIDVPQTLEISKFMKGFVYEFKIRMSVGELGEKLIEFLKSRYELEMDAIYQFELIELQMMDVESDGVVNNSEDEIS